MHTYVYIGKFSSDFIEKEFSKLRQGLGGTYFITVQQILEKVNMKKTSLLLSLNADVNTLDTPSGHQCSYCHYNLDEDGIEIFDNLETLENSLAIDTVRGHLYRNPIPCAKLVTSKLLTELCLVSHNLKFRGFAIFFFLSGPYFLLRININFLTIKDFLF